MHTFVNCIHIFYVIISYFRNPPKKIRYVYLLLNLWLTPSPMSSNSLSVMNDFFPDLRFVLCCYLLSFLSFLCV